MTTRKTLLMVLTSQVASANTLAESLQFNLDGTQNGQFSFTVDVYPLHAPDDTTPYGKWCAPVLNDADHAIVIAQLVNFPGSVVQDYDPIENPSFPDQWLAANNLRRALPKLL